MPNSELISSDRFQELKNFCFHKSKNNEINATVRKQSAVSTPLRSSSDEAGYPIAFVRSRAASSVQQDSQRAPPSSEPDPNQAPAGWQPVEPVTSVEAEADVGRSSDSNRK